MGLLRAGVEEQGLRCRWAPFCLLYALNNAHKVSVYHRDDLGRLRLSPVASEGWSDNDNVVAVGLMNPNTGGYAGRMEVQGETATFRPALGQPALSFFRMRREGLSVGPEASDFEAQLAIARYWRQPKAEREYFQREGMVPPTQRDDLDQTIEWLFLDLLFPEISWRDKTKCINQFLYYERRRLRDAYYPANPPQAHIDFSYSNVATHVNDLREPRFPT